MRAATDKDGATTTRADADDMPDASLFSSRSFRAVDPLERAVDLPCPDENAI